MDIISFEVPTLGSSYIMQTDAIRIRFKDDHLLLYCNKKNDIHIPVSTTLYRTRRNHNEIIQFLEDTPNPQFIMKKVNKYKHTVFFDRNLENLGFVMNMLTFLFPNEKMSIEFIMCGDRYEIGKCSFHLFDLYEIGYMSMVPVNIYGDFYYKYNTRIFTGVLLVARNPFGKCPYDFIELSFFNNYKQSFFKLCFDMLINSCPHLSPKINCIITKLIASIPLKEDTIVHKQIIDDWTTHHDMEIKTTDLRVPLQEWNPIIFMKHLSKLLDMFPDYYICPKFSLETRTN